MTDEKMTQVGFKANSDAHERAKRRLEHGELSRRLRETVEEIAYGTETTERRRLKEKLDDLRQDKRDVENEIENKRHERDELDREIARVEDRLDTMIQQDGEYDGFLQSMESDLRDGMRFDIGHGKVEDAAETGDCSREQVIQDLKERNPDVPDRAFREPKPGEAPLWNEVQQ